MGDRKEWQRHVTMMIFVMIWYEIDSQVFWFVFLFTKSAREGKVKKKIEKCQKKTGTMKQSSRLSFIFFKHVWSIHTQYSVSIASAARPSSLLMAVWQNQLQLLVHLYIYAYTDTNLLKSGRTCVKIARPHAAVTHLQTLGAVTQHKERQTAVPVAGRCIRSSRMRLDWWQNDKTGILSFIPHRPKSTADRQSGKNRLGPIRRAPTRRGSI